ncbi:phosphodiesterase [Rhodoferax sp. OV413]|uniref:phosphodiesterase n=1 Tax=Rhodoferax sp. OV413 TaxID=1855285 RepID=UPI0025CE1C01|nr:phosphodiesterase [Rhodoferax sp. OV413]
MPSAPLQPADVPTSTGLSREALRSVITDHALSPVFQPIVKLDDGSFYAHEALIRGPQGSDFYMPEALFGSAAAAGMSFDLEIACIGAVLKQWGRLNTAGRLFVNISADVMISAMEQHGVEGLLRWIQECNVTPRSLVLEITEHDRVENMDRLAEVVEQVRSIGLSLALDDFGDGHSSLRLWSQLKPEVVKIDKYFIRNLSADGDKLKTIQALQQIASIFGSALVAEGVENAQDLRILRDLGIEYGQGYFLGRPEVNPLKTLLSEPRRVLSERQVAVFPELGRLSQGGHLRSLSLINAPTVNPNTSIDDLARIFMEDSQLHAIAVTEGDRPVGIINRAQFMNEYSKLYYREVWGRKPCFIHANREPRLIEREHSVDELVGILTSQDQRYLSDGFIVTENGSYVGLGTGDQLVRSVTETRIEAARHANPLTFLPGNIPITQHIERLLKKQVRFVACYADLNHFKPYNDYYGYWRGDEMIRLLARIAMEQCDSQRDFLGHVGGDDFIILFQSPDWLKRCERLVNDFAERARMLFDEDARTAGGIEAEDRHGVRRFFPCTTVSVGALVVDGAVDSGAEGVANLAAMAKHEAKLSPSGIHQIVLS